MKSSASTSTSSPAVNAAVATSTTSAGSAKPPVVIPGLGSNIIVNPSQRGNPVLECIRNVGKTFGDVVVDYQVGRTTGVFYLSLRYHRLHPEYIHQRIERLGSSYNLRILLILCDVSEHQDTIKELTKICLINNVTIMVAWNLEEAGYYLATYKQFEHKPPDLIKERVDKDYNSMLRTALTSISKVNKTDVEILRTSIGSFADIAKATSEQLLQLPGFGQVKVKRLKDAFDKPFRNSSTSTIPFQSQRIPQQAPDNEPAPAISGNDKGKGKEKVADFCADVDVPTASSSQHRPREPTNPTWDIELDLNTSPSPEHQPPAHQAQSGKPTEKTRKRPPSPVWDIELDLNESDEEESSRKRHKGDDEEAGEGFRPTDLL